MTDPERADERERCARIASHVLWRVLMRRNTGDAERLEFLKSIHWDFEALLRNALSDSISAAKPTEDELDAKDEGGERC